MKNYTFAINTELLAQVMIDKLHFIESEIKVGLLEYGITTEDDLMSLADFIGAYLRHDLKYEVIINGNTMKTSEIDSRLIALGLASGCINIAKITLEHQPYFTFVEMVHMADSFLFSIQYKTPLSVDELNKIQGNYKTELARSGAEAKNAKDPKQIAKNYIFNCWEVWQEESDKYNSKADFARTMLKLDICKSLKSQKKIEDWCRDFEKKHPLS